MKPILRFLQLLCENHNRTLQNLLRDQHNKTKVRPKTTAAEDHQ